MTAVLASFGKTPGSLFFSKRHLASHAFSSADDPGLQTSEMGECIETFASDDSSVVQRHFFFLPSK